MKNKDTKDLVMKDFEAYPDVAADLLNVFLHEGQQRVKQENLLAAPTETLYQGQEKLRNQLEDVGKYEMHSGRVRAMYLFANQSESIRKCCFVRLVMSVVHTVSSIKAGKMPSSR